MHGVACRREHKLRRRGNRYWWFWRSSKLRACLIMLVCGCNRGLQQRLCGLTTLLKARARRCEKHGTCVRSGRGLWRWRTKAILRVRVEGF